MLLPGEREVVGEGVDRPAKVWRQFRAGSDNTKTLAELWNQRWKGISTWLMADRSPPPGVQCTRGVEEGIAVLH